MATGGQPDVQDAMECRICMRLMTDPRVLPCGHTFCYQCLELLVQDNRIKCPTCRVEVHLGAQGVSAIPKNFTMIQLITALNEQHIPETTGTGCAVCHIMLSGIGEDEWSCIDCKDNLCTQCAHAHRERTIFENHELVSLATINNMKCSRHPGKKHTHICVDCDVAICSICAGSNHHNHKVEDANKYLAQFKHKIAMRWVKLKNAPTIGVPEYPERFDFQKIEIEVRQTFTSIQSEIDKAAKRDIAKIKKQQADLQAKLAADKVVFDQFVNGIKNAELLKTKVEELRTNPTIKELETKTRIAAPQQELTNLRSLALDINTLIDQLESSETQRSSFDTMSIPKSFTASYPDYPIGTINMTKKIQPDLRIKNMYDAKSIILKPDSTGNIGILLQSPSAILTKIFTFLGGNRIYVGSISRTGPAHSDGRLKLYDRVLAVNGQDISRLTKQEVRNIIKDTRGAVTLTVMEPKPGFNPNPSEQNEKYWI